MFLTLAKRTLRDSGAMLVSCLALAFLFVVLKAVATSKLKVDAMLTMLSETFTFLQDLLPVSIHDLASPLGRIAFTFEEGPLLAATGLWAIARGSECLVGRTSSGAMELLLAQPVRRTTVVASHVAATLLGAAALSLATWLGVFAALALAHFDPQPVGATLWPAAANHLASQVFQIGAATLVAAVARSRTQAVGVMIGFYVVELTLLILARLLPDWSWLYKLTFMSAYQPTALTLGILRDTPGAWPLFWKYEFCLLGCGLALIAVATAIFCRRDVPAPL